MQELFYCRHGQSVDLADKIRSRPETPLTLLGWSQARSAGDMLIKHKVVPTLIASSMLPRAIQTAQAIADVIGYDAEGIISHSLLNERCWGDATGMPNSEVFKRWPDFDYVPGAENLQTLQQRANEATEWLCTFSTTTLLVVGHGAIGRAVMRAFENRPTIDEYSSTRVSYSNGQIIRLYPRPTTVLE